MNTPMARVSFKRCSSDVRSRAGAAGGAGFAFAAVGAAGGVDEVAGRGTSDLGASVAGAPAPLPVFRGAVGGFGFEVIPWELASLLAEGRLGVELAGEGVCPADGIAAPEPALAASDPCDGFCCSAGCGAGDAGELG